MQHNEGSSFWILLNRLKIKNPELILISIPDRRQSYAGQDGVFSFKLEGDNGVGADLARPLAQLVKHVLIEVLLKCVKMNRGMISIFSNRSHPDD